MARSAQSLAKLEARLLEHPDDLDHWHVYADALSESGDPRGELVSIGVALARGERRRATLDKREQALLEANADAWFGKLASEDEWRECFAYALHAGYWSRIRVWLDYDHRTVELGKLLAYALAQPSAQFLRELDVGLPNAEGSGDYKACIKAIVAQGPLRSLRRLTIGDFEYPEESEISWVEVGEVGKLWDALPKLDTLVLRGANIRLGKVASTSLRSLTLQTGGLPRQAGDSLASAELPHLEQLHVWFGTQNYGGSCGAAQVRGILANKTYKRLRSLALANADFADDIVRELVRVKLPPKLERLDLSMGTMTDAGASVLLDAAARFEGLQELDLGANFLSRGMGERLRRALPNAKVANQKQARDDWYYVSVGE